MMYVITDDAKKKGKVPMSKEESWCDNGTFICKDKPLREGGLSGLTISDTYTCNYLHLNCYCNL